MLIFLSQIIGSEKWLSEALIHKGLKGGTLERVTRLEEDWIGKGGKGEGERGSEGAWAGVKGRKAL